MWSRYVLACVLLVVAVCLVAESRPVNYATRVLDSFDDPEARQWIVVGSKFSVEGYPQVKYVKAWPLALFGNTPPSGDVQCLGVHAQFRRRSDNYIEFIPVKADENGQTLHDPIEISGRAKYLDMWVWGSNYNFAMEVHLIDHRGIAHVLPLGSLRYQGWRNVHATIPEWIPQEVTHVPKAKTLKLTRLVLWTAPTERVDDFYVYIDHLKVLTDLFTDSYDGDTLGDSGTIEQLWGGESSGD